MSDKANEQAPAEKLERAIMRGPSVEYPNTERVADLKKALRQAWHEGFRAGRDKR